ncbi:hypothetical protein BDV25DRAFT_137097 [Aspergillus avenaceus]|uniref:Acetyl-CoA synthetase-like protein n=1 Tax=Aspergillus avenaceus TaxID=36643 RepID=A0A5N6U3I8_ASPAV|nr:hypothetical protein BDV25DRAFT_137097 [Aspergillus avenaceus]
MGEQVEKVTSLQSPLEPCLFPILNTTASPREHSASVPVNLEAKETIQSFCALYDIAFSDLFQVAWAIILRAYTGSDFPVFRLVKRGDGPNSKDQICFLDLSYNAQAQSLSTKLRRLPASQSGDWSKLLNTALVIDYPVTISDQLPVILELTNSRGAWTVKVNYSFSLLTTDQALDLADLVEHVATQISHVNSWEEIDLCASRTLQRLSEWNSSHPEMVLACAHDSILRQCALRPEATAICAWDGNFTYGEVDRLSLALAKDLIYRGVRPDKFVGIYLEKSRWAAIAILGVMRAGGAFLLMDVNLPSALLEDKSQQLGIQWILTTGSLESDASRKASEVIAIDRLTLKSRNVTSHTQEAPLSSVKPHHALFAVYTSNSTGTHKGIIISHRSYCSAQKAMEEVYKLGPSTRLLQFSSYAYDLSVHDHLSTLMAGGCVCIPSETQRQHHLQDAIQELRVDTLALTPTVARSLSPASIPIVETVLMDGEPLCPADIARWDGHARVIAMYGPVECCVCTSARCMSSSMVDSRVIGSGTGALCWIVDPTDYNKLAPIGAVGELLVDGPIVGRGYVHDTGTTDSPSIPSPAWRQAFAGAASGGRMYRTGDLAQYVTDGQIRIIGRKDSRVTLHGQRLQLDETEHQLRCLLSDKMENVVIDLIALAGSEGNPVLCAFILDPSASDFANDKDNPLTHPSDPFRAAVQHVVARLSHRLPQYMIPSVILSLRSIPMTITGKTDRRRLRQAASELSREELDSFTTSALCGDTEDMQNNTDESVAPFSLVDEKLLLEESIGSIQSLCGLSDPSDIEDIYPCTPVQEDMMDGPIASPKTRNITRCVFRLIDDIRIPQLRDAWDSVLRHNPILRTRLVRLKASDQALQVVVRPVTPWEVSDSLDRYIESDLQEKIESGRPLLRLAIVQSRTERHFAMTIHHALCDRQTLTQVLQQVEEAYMGQEPQSKPFNIFVKHLLSLDMKNMEEYWRRKLANFAAPLFPNAPAAEYRPDTVQTVKHPSPVILPNIYGITPPTVVKLAWALTLSQYAGTDDVVFGMALAGRNPSDQDGAIMGPTSTTIPLRIKLNRAMQTREVLRSIQHDAAVGQPFEQFGLHRIECLGPHAESACRFQSALLIEPPKNHSWQIFNSPMDIPDSVDNYMLTVKVTPSDNNRIGVELTYDPKAIAEPLMNGILRQFLHHLSAISEGADCALRDLPALNQTDLKTIQGWNSRIPATTSSSVHDRIWRRCRDQGTSLAVDAWDGTLTYEDLDKESNRIAAHLQRSGARFGSTILIYLGKTKWTVAAMVAVMKTGAAFVLLDECQRIAQLREIAEATKASTVIASHRTLPAANELCAVVHNVERPDADIADTFFQPPFVRPEDPVYVAFTGDASEKAEGVIIKHQALHCSATLNGRTLSIHSDSRVLQFAPFTSDVSIAEMIYPLVHGGCVCIPSEREVQRNLEKTINDFAVTWATMTPSSARVLTPSRLPSLRTLALGDEELTAEDISRWADTLQLIHSYRPGECTMGATIQDRLGINSDPNNLGSSVAAVPWIIDPQDPNVLRPVGAVGELVLEGPVLARGYLNDPEKTADSFIEYPEWLRRLRDISGRLYRTGELMQYRLPGDGSLRYIRHDDRRVRACV